VPVPDLVVDEVLGDAEVSAHVLDREQLAPRLVDPSASRPRGARMRFARARLCDLCDNPFTPPSLPVSLGNAVATPLLA
jgi:hypothetical protein